jgi:hypothetical protein
MADPRSGMNLPAPKSIQSIGNVKAAVQDAMGSVDALAQKINNTSNRSVEVYQGGSVSSPNQVAVSPRFTPPATPIVPYAGGPGGPGGRGPGVFGGFGYGDDNSDNQVFKQPMSYGRNLTNYVKQNPAAAMLYAGAIGAGALSSTEEVTQAELMLQGAAFFSGDYNGRDRKYSGKAELGFPFNKNFRTGGSSDYEAMGRFQSDISRTGTVNNKMDAMTALVAAQSYGITGPNFTQGAAGGLQGSIMGGIANVSNILPGAGIEGTTRAYGAMQAAKNVNMLRGIGIRIRDEDGNMKPPDQIIDDIWKKICKDYAQAYGASKTPSQREVMIGLQPGNSLYSMLDIYFGGDPILRQMMINGLIFKARTGSGDISKQAALDAGASTESVVAKSQQNATAAQGLFQVAKAGSSGFKNATQTLTIGGLLMNQLDNVTGVLKGATYTKSFAETMLNGGNGMGQDLAKGLLSILGLGGGKAKGGKVDDEIPYIVGELGPELFIPKTDGVIIPNHLTGRRNRHQGGGVHAAHEGRTLEEAEVRNILAQAGFEGQDLENAVDVARAESNFRTNAEGDKGLTSNTWDYSIGLFQIRSLKDYKKFNDPKREPLHLYDPLENAKAAKQIFDGGGGRWDKAWVNTSRKLGLTGVESGQSPNPEAVEEAVGIPTQENGQPDYIAQLGAAATSGELQKKLATFDPSSLTSSQLSQYFGSSGFDANKPTTAHNYGGVTININAAAASANDIYKIIEKMLTEGALMQAAASK